MQIKRKERIHYLEVAFPGAVGSVQGFTTRHEGVSRAPYNSLNLGMNTDDQQFNVEGNRSLLARAFGISQERLVTVRQTHGNDILVIDESNDDFSHFLSLECDAIITNQPNVMIGVTVADCVPILMYDGNRKVVAAVHAGWQGTASRIVAKAVEGMVSVFGSSPADIQVALGPCIGPCCYRVDVPVKNAFNQTGIEWDAVSVKVAAGEWQLDLIAANRLLLLEAGITDTSILDSGMCVCCKQELFFSYRRDEGQTGRQMGFIMLV